MKKVLGIIAGVVITFAFVVTLSSDPDPPPKLLSALDKDVVNTYSDPDPPPKQMM